MIPVADPIVGLLVAALGGAAIGLERQRSGHADGPLPHFAGLRTVTLLGAAAGLAGWLWRMDYGPFGLILLGAAAALVVVAYGAAARKDLDATTEVAAVVVLGAGVLAGLGYVALASGVFALMGLLLLEKAELHALAARLDDAGLRAAVYFGVMSLVVLPLLPEGPLTALAIRPRQLWLLVLFFSGISFAGFVARRLVGLRKGYAVAGLIGGLVSSTNVTLTFARLSRSEPASATALGLGAVAANAVLFPRVLLTTWLLNPALGAELWPLLLAPFALVLLVALLGGRWSDGHEAAAPPLTNPLQIGAALQMAALFQGVIWLVDWMGRFAGRSGLLTTAAVLGVTDVDALTVSMARVQATGATSAVQAIGVGVLANTLFKLVLALGLGQGAYRWIVGGVLVVVAAMLVAGVLGVGVL